MVYCFSNYKFHQILIYTHDVQYYNVQFNKAIIVLQD